MYCNPKGAYFRKKELDAEAVVFAEFVGYYGYTAEEAQNLPHSHYITLVHAMRQVKAREWLQVFELNIVPKMNQSDRDKVRRRLYKQAYPERFDRQNVASNLNQLVEMLRKGNG